MTRLGKQQTKLKSFPYALAAEAIARSDFENNEQVARELGISRRTLQRYRERLAHDPKLQAYYDRISSVRVGTVARRIPTSIEKLLKFIEQGSEELDPADPESIKVIAGATSALVEVMVVLDRYAGSNDTPPE